MKSNDTLKQLGGKAPTLTAKEALILSLLGPTKEMYGLEMVEASDGELKRGTVYVTLDRMEEKGFVESRQEARNAGAIGLPRRLYRITALGSTTLREWRLLATNLNLAWQGATR